MTKKAEIFDFLCKKYPLDTAMEFDNVGFLVGDKNEEVSKKAVLSLDCDINTVSFAKKEGANLIITHHPVIFNPLKNVCENTEVFEAVKNGIAIISMHTNLDSGKGGVNDCLCAALGLKAKPYTAKDGFTIRSAKTDCDVDEFAKLIKEKLGYSVRYTGMGRIKKLLICSGGGADYLDDAIENGYDGLVTADCRQHQFIKAINCGVALFDCGHYASENVVIKPLCELLKKQFKDTEFIPYDNAELKFV